MQAGAFHNLAMLCDTCLCMLFSIFLHSGYP
jgi:hypothetical protein